MGTDTENPESSFNQKAVEGERVLFDRGGIKVTQYRFVVERTVYAMHNITSIQHEIDQPPTPPDKHYRNFAIAGGVACVIGIAFSAYEVVRILFFVGVALLAYAFMGARDMLPDFLQDLHVRPQAPPAKHTVKLTSAAGEVEAFSTTDGGVVAEVLSALNQAIVLNRPK